MEGTQSAEEGTKRVPLFDPLCLSCRPELSRVSGGLGLQTQRPIT